MASRPGAQDAQRLAGDRAGSGRDAFADRTTNLAHAFGAQLCRIRDARPGAVTLEFVRSDTLADPIPRAAPRRIPDRRDKGRRESTKVSYRDALRPVREHLGNRKLQSITKADIENLVDWMLTSGRKRGGKPGAGLGPRSVRLTLGRLKAAFEMAVDEGRLVRNVVKLVTPPEYKPQERDIWSKAEVRKFLRTAAPTRLHAAWRLSLYGLGRGEVLGLRWSDIDLKAKTLTVQQARVLVDYKVRVEEPKSHNGKRVLPLDDDLVAALTELRKRQARESEDAGTAYGADLADLDWWAAGNRYVVVDQLGIPLHPESYSDEFTRVLKLAGLPEIRLHDSRHTTLSLLEKVVRDAAPGKQQGHLSHRRRWP